MNSPVTANHWCYYICAHFSKISLRLSYTCAHKSGTFALSFGVTFARIFSQLFLGQLLVFYKVLALLPLFTDLVISLFGLSKGSATAFCLYVCLSARLSMVLSFSSAWS